MVQLRKEDKLMAKLIAIDDGHGMETSGKRTPTGITSIDTGKNFMHENEFNRAVAKYLKAHLERNGFRTLMVAPTDADTSLSTRVATSNNAKADFYISIHANALAGKWGTHGGTETLTYGSGESLRIGKIIHKHLMKGTPMRDRGIKDGSWLYVVKNTNAPAVLIEAGFMDNLAEAKLLNSDSFRRECAREIAMGICEGFGVTYKAESTPAKPQPTATIYRVRLHWSDAKTQKGAYENLQSAKDLANSLKSQGDYRVFDEKGNVVYDPTPVKQDEVWYRVRKTWADAKSQIGAFHDVEGAKELADSKVGEGYKVFDNNGKVVYEPKPKEQDVIHTVVAGDTLWGISQKYNVEVEDIKSKNKLTSNVISIGQKLVIKGNTVVEAPKVEQPKPAPTPAPQPKPEEPKPAPKPEPTPVVDPHEGHTVEICGEAKVVSVDKMVAFVKAKNPNAQDIEEIAKQFLEVGKLYGIRGDIAFCQSIIETGWFKFDGGTAVTPDQHNYCGLGVTSKGMKGNSFDTVKDGVTAQIQHLFAYASKDSIPNGEFIIDPRFKYVTRGIAPHWEDLSNRWAMNANYGTHILSLFTQLEKFEYIPPAKGEEEVVETPVKEEEKQPEQETTVEDNSVTIKNWKEIVDYIFKKLAEFFGKK
jgi:N-acetylmuramoyl-L-alanine amidase/LysM repeat protein